MKNAQLFACNADLLCIATLLAVDDREYRNVPFVQARQGNLTLRIAARREEPVSESRQNFFPIPREFLSALNCQA